MQILAQEWICLKSIVVGKNQNLKVMFVKELFKKYTHYKDVLRKIARQASCYQGKMLCELNRKIYFTKYNFEINQENPKITVSLTTHGKRIYFLHYVLDSLYTQTLRPYRVCLYLTKDEYTNLPLMLKKFEPWLQIKEVEDLKSFKKFIPALLHAKEKEIIVSLDDDFLYPPTMVEELYSLFLSHKKKGFFSFLGFHHVSGDEFLGHTGIGCLWNTEMFNEQNYPEFFNLEYIKSIEKSNDDLWISKFLISKDIKTYSCYDYVDGIGLYVPLFSADMNALTWSGGHESEKYISAKDNVLLNNQFEQYFLGEKH